VEKRPFPPQRGLELRVEELRAALRLLHADQLAGRTGSHYRAIGAGRGEFRFSLFESPAIFSFPELVAYNDKDDPYPGHIQALVVYYFYTADGAPLGGQWTSFADLPDGRIYNQAYQGYSGDEVVKVFGLNVEKFKQACERAGGRKMNFGDAAYVFQALPRLPLLVNYWCGDEDFPSTCKILFDTSVTHYLPMDVAAILGGMLARRLARNAG